MLNDFPASASRPKEAFARILRSGEAGEDEEPSLIDFREMLETVKL